MPRTLIVLLLLGWPAGASAQVVNECAQTWTFDAAMHTLRNGVDVGGIGHMSTQFYSCVNKADVYVVGQDGASWFKYAGGTSGTWSFSGSDPGGIRFYGPGPVNYVETECDRDWTFGAAHETLRDRVPVGGGLGTEYRCFQSIVWVLGTDFIWYQWDGKAWLRGTATVPGYDATLGEVVSLAWAQIDFAEVTGWDVQILGQPHKDVALTSAVDGKVSIPFPTTITGEFVVKVGSQGCLNRDAATKTCLQFGQHDALPITVRVNPVGVPLPAPQAPTGARVQ